MFPSDPVAAENGCFQSLRAPSVAVAEASVFSDSSAELEVMHQFKGKGQEWKESWETWGRWYREGEWEGMEGKDRGGDTGTGVEAWWCP